jgi:hypothetical protein
MGLALAATAQAGTPFTLKCSGLRSWSVAAGRPTESPERVINYYTIQLTDSGGQIYGWHEHRWSPLRAGEPQSYTLERAASGMNWRLSIARADGAWSEVWSGEQHTISISGRCTQVRLRKPPVPPPDQ